MKIILIAFVLIISFSKVSFSQDVKPNFNQKLADSLGADDFGMKEYVFCLLKTGPSKITDKYKLNQLFVIWKILINLQMQVNW